MRRSSDLLARRRKNNYNQTPKNQTGTILKFISCYNYDDCYAHTNVRAPSLKLACERGCADLMAWPDSDRQTRHCRYRRHAGRTISSLTFKPERFADANCRVEDEKPKCQICISQPEKVSIHASLLASQNCRCVHVDDQESCLRKRFIRIEQDNVKWSIILKKISVPNVSFECI